MTESFSKGVQIGLAMDPDQLELIGVLGLVVVFAVGLLLARAVYRFITR